nr:MFS transporter [Brachybacterium halotolerans]
MTCPASDSRFGCTDATIGTAVLATTTVLTVCTVAASVAGGWVSDKIRRRKICVLISALIVALAHIVAAISPSFSVLLVAIALAGLANGVYRAVDRALIAEVLPSRKDVAKDMGVLHLANVLPQTLVPVTASLFLMIGGGGENYPALFIGGRSSEAWGRSSTNSSARCGERQRPRCGQRPSGGACLRPFVAAGLCGPRGRRAVSALRVREGLTGASGRISFSSDE